MVDENCRVFKSSDIRIKLTRFVDSKIISYLSRHDIKGAAQLRSMLDKILPKVSCSVVVPTTLGFSMMVEPSIGKGLEKAIYGHGSYEAGTLAVIRSILCPGDIFFDIGANIGLMSLTAATKVGEEGRVYAFEPLAELCHIIRENIRLNDLKNITVLEKALGTEKASKSIFTSFNINRGTSTLVKPKYESTELVIEVERLDDFIIEKNIQAIKAMKVDVEGWELEVLRGATNLLCSKYAPIIIIECSDMTEQSKPLDLYKFLTDINNYEIFRLKRGKDFVSSLVRIEDSDDLPRHDNLFCFLPEHKHGNAESLF